MVEQPRSEWQQAVEPPHTQWDNVGNTHCRKSSREIRSPPPRVAWAMWSPPPLLLRLRPPSQSRTSPAHNNELHGRNIPHPDPIRQIPDKWTTTPQDPLQTNLFLHEVTHYIPCLVEPALCSLTYVLDATSNEEHTGFVVSIVLAEILNTTVHLSVRAGLTPCSM